jgi:hypothetical protein
MRNFAALRIKLRRGHRAGTMQEGERCSTG